MAPVTNPTARETPDLREALERIANSNGEMFVEWDGWREVRRLRDIAAAALTTPEPAPAVLDVERLARALRTVHREHATLQTGNYFRCSHDGYVGLRGGDGPYATDTTQHEAEALAAAYAALTATPSEATDG